MNDSTIQKQLARIQFLLVAVVALLAGLVLGETPRSRMVYAAGSFVAFQLVFLIVIDMQSSPPE